MLYLASHIANKQFIFRLHRVWWQVNSAYHYANIWQGKVCARAVGVCLCLCACMCVCISQQSVFGGWRHSASSTCPLENPSSNVCAPPMCLHAGTPSGIFPLSHSWSWSVVPQPKILHMQQASCFFVVFSHMRLQKYSYTPKFFFFPHPNIRYCVTDWNKNSA